ncbi:MAG TPA: FAD-binding protein [Bryobacteraceae bacterium]|jgi:xylitol oxidase|nr:FAD-binding protein [Bryobacteraceae bacterium]
MDKRKFLKTSAAILAGDMLSRVSGFETNEPRTNWSGNFRYHAKNLYQPESVEEVQKIVKSCRTLKTLGARHSFNNIADSSENQISLAKMTSVEIDANARTATVGAGIEYGRLAPQLDGHGFALHNLASLPQITVAGARSTATHGSGNKNGNLATAVVGLELVTPDGEIAKLSREHNRETFQGCVVDLGALGVVTKVTLAIEPTFQMRQVVYQNLSFNQLEKHLDDIFAAGYSVSLFTDWQNHRATQVWIKSKVEPGRKFEISPEFYGATAAKVKLHPLAGHSAESCTDQLGIPGPWYDRMPHFRMNFTPSSGNELQTEYLVPRARAWEAIRAVEGLRDQITPHLFITELRTIDADTLWMSTAYQRPSLAIHFTWKPEWPEVHNVLPRIEEALKPFDARPHWAKLFTMPGSRIQPLYAKLPEFQTLVRHYDPTGKFRNQYLNSTIFT